nr:hypothetical protein [Nitrospiraceae bacterium]
MKKEIIFVLMLLFFSASQVFGQGKVYSNKDLRQYENGPSPSSLNITSSPISIDFLDANLYQVLRMIAEVAKSKDQIEIFVSPDIAGKITIKKDNIPWNEVLRIIAAQHDLTVAVLGKHTILVYRKNK